jgi:acetaldehyde dehydrogenase/alcohol dehydrogenase
VIGYNAQEPTKFAIFPKYGKFVADERYAQIARYLGFGGATKEEQVQALINEVRKLMADLGMPKTIAECGVKEDEFLAKLSALAEHAFEDQCTTANPRYPLVTELMDIYKKAYYGE